MRIYYEKEKTKVQLVLHQSIVQSLLYPIKYFTCGKQRWSNVFRPALSHYSKNLESLS